MKRLAIALALVFACGVAYAQRGATVTVQPINVLPQCSAVSGSCPNPSGGYFCTHATTNVLYMCRSDTGWTTVDAGSILTTTDVSGSCNSGEIAQKTDATSGQQLYLCESGSWVLQAGSGGGGGSTTFSGLIDTSVSAPGSGHVLVWDGVNSWDNKAVSGDMTITSGGVVTIAADAVALTTDTTGNYVSSATANRGLVVSGTEGASIGLITTCADGELLKYTSSGSTWGCAADSSGSGGSAQILDLGDDASNESTDINEVATTGDTNNIFTEPIADKLLINLGNNWPAADTASTATALAANGANCSAGEIALGVDASGAVEGCYEPAFTDVTGTATDAQIPSEVVKSDESTTWSTGLQVIDGDTDEIQLRVQGHSTQTADLFVVEKSDGTDLFTVDESEATFADPGDGSRGVELIDNSATCADPASGSTSICTIGAQVYLRDTGGSVVRLLDESDATAAGDITAVWGCTSGDCSTLTGTTGDSINAGGADDMEIPNGTNPTVDTTGQISLDTSDDQIRYYGASSSRVLSPTTTFCAVIEDLTSTDDNFEIYMPSDAITVTAVGCHCKGTCTTAASVSLETRAGTSMTHTAPTCSTGTSSATFQSVTASGAVAAGGGLRFDVDNTPSPETDEYTICFAFTYDAQ